jgi:type I restriction enzyme M protein
MALKKSELYSSLWKSCDELRGGMDASQYKDYVLVLLFFKYVSDKYAGDPSALIDVPAGGTLMQLRFASFAVINLRRECTRKSAPVPGAQEKGPPGGAAGRSVSLRSLGRLA